MSKEILKKHLFYKAIYQTLEQINFIPELIHDEDVIVLSYKDKDKASFQICFWLDENRVTCFLEEFEVLDEYLNNKIETNNLKYFIKEFLSNNVKKEVFKNNRSIIIKTVLHYIGLENNIKKVYIENQSFKFIFPWVKVNREEIIYSPWIGNGLPSSLFPNI